MLQDWIADITIFFSKNVQTLAENIHLQYFLA